MILNAKELALVAIAIQYTEDADTAVRFHITNRPSGRDVEVQVCAGGITARLSPPDSAPVVEHYKTPMGLAMAYRVPLGVLTGQDPDAD